MTDPSDPIHVLRPSPARRAMALVLQGTLGLLLIWLALAQPPEGIVWRVVLLALGVGALVMAARGWRGAATALELRADGVWSEDGTLVAPLDAIASVDRGAFAFKPSNGFVLRLDRSLGRAWSPGMWWRLGRRVGVGGVVSGADAKFVADALSVMIRQRDA